jgi:hypothetical protein
MLRMSDKAHKTALQIVGFEDRTLSKLFGFPASKRELLDRFQVQLVVFPDRIDLKATFGIAPITCQNVTLP